MSTYRGDVLIIEYSGPELTVGRFSGHARICVSSPFGGWATTFRFLPYAFACTYMFTWDRGAVGWHLGLFAITLIIFLHLEHIYTRRGGGSREATTHGASHRPLLLGYWWGLASCNVRCRVRGGPGMACSAVRMQQSEGEGRDRFAGAAARVVAGLTERPHEN